MAESNLNKLIQELSPDELDESIEIVKQLQKVLVNADGSESAGELSDIHPDVKQEEYDIVLSEPGNPLSKGSTTASKTDSENIYRDALSDDFKEIFSDPQAKIFCELISLMSSISEDTPQSPTFSYKEVEDISHVKEEHIEINLNKSEFPEVSTSVDEYSIHGEVNSEYKVNPEYFRCGSGRDSVTNRDIEVTTIREYASEYEISIGQCPIRREMEKQLNRAEREIKMDLTREKQTMQTNSRSRRKNRNLFCGSKIQTKTCSKEKTKVCEFCQEQFQSLFDLEKHVKIHTGRMPYTCEMCEHKFTEKWSLNRHKKTHSGERPYKCEICHHKFTEKGGLKIHKRTHSGERPYKCEICEYKCTQKSDLNKHIRKHSGERPYKCEICNHKFTQKVCLKIHMRTHSGERPYKCEICEHKCTKKWNLKIHMKTHTRD